MQVVDKDNKYNIYQVTLDNAVSIEPGLCKIYFLIIQNNIVKTISAGNIHIEYDNFSAANKLFLMDELTREMKLLCKKTEEFTKMNIQLYKDIKEAVASK